MVDSMERCTTGTSAGAFSQQSRRGLPDSPMASTITSFFDLPQEIRDNVYERAFGHEPRLFNYAGSTYGVLHAAPHAFVIDDTDNVSFAKGLPTWLPSNKKICAEALEVFARTRTFEWGVAREKECDDPRVRGATMPSNPLVMTAGVMRTIRARPADFTYATRSIPAKVHKSRTRTEADYFINEVKAMQGQDMVLELQWDRWWHGKFLSGDLAKWDVAEEDVFDIVGPDWDGRFRKVELRFTYYVKQDEEFRKMLVFGEKRAQNLVGGAFTAKWGEETKTVSPRWTRWDRCLTVERKI